MLGAIIGDIVGSVHEYKSKKSKKFKLFTKRSRFTDDTVMTIAVADALLNGGTADNFIDSMKKFGRLYPDADCGGRFRQWLLSDDRSPYNSFGNGSAMRVSPCAWFANSLEEAERLAELSASVTHNHPEGINGAKATAAAIYLVRTGKRASVKDYIQSKCGYDLSRSLDEIRPDYQFNETCQETVPEAITALLESEGFEDAIRNAVSLGGDADTLAAIAGSIAEAEYGIRHDTLTEGIRYLDDNLSAVINAWLDRGLSTGGRMVKNSGQLDYNHWHPKEFSKPRKIKAGFQISETQLARVRFGLWPRQMEDKWFIYFENSRICCHRSWTGYRIYEAEVKKGNTGYTIPEMTVERDAELYGCSDDSEDIRQFHYLIGCGILGLNLNAPIGKSDADLLSGWSRFGRG